MRETVGASRQGLLAGSHSGRRAAVGLLLGCLSISLPHDVSAQAVQQPPAKQKPARQAAASAAEIAIPPLPVPNPRRAVAAPADPAGKPTAAAGTVPTVEPTVTPGAGQPPAVVSAAAAGEGHESTAAPAVAKPEPPTPEAQYMARLDELIAPVRDFAPSAEDIKRIKDAIRLAATDVAASRATRAQITDPAARRLVEWLALRGGVGEPQDYVAFLEGQPAWPDRNLLIRRFEEQVFTSGGNVQRIKSFFKSAEPRTGAGWAALASAYLAEGDQGKAREAAARTWREFELAASLEHGFLERFAGLLTEADHRRRLDRILVDEVRFSAERNDRAAIARRLLPHLSEGERKKAEARIAVFLRAKNAAQLLGALPAEAEGQPPDWGLAYQRVQHFRRLGQHEEAWKILTAAPTDPDLIVSPDDWWAERRAAAYEALRAGKSDVAYSLVRDAGPLSGNPLKDQTFLAGWIAFRLLEKPELAVSHFEASRAAADGPLSRARADYWLGRVLEALGKRDVARKRYEAAASDADTFHGQLARHKVTGAGQIDIRAGLPVMPSPQDVQRFNAHETVRAAVIAGKVLDRSIKASLFGHLRNTLEGEGTMAMLAHLAGALGDTQTSLRVAKTGISRGMNLIMYGYPLHAFPTYTPLRDPPEQAMLLAIARQETEFNPSIVSTAGARGLLQVMPVTAQHICRDHKIKCDLPRLLTDNAYNATIASAYIGDRMADVRGNYVLTLASYNAGPGRARQWMREFGDPRDAGVDPIDWIERIPIEETREYVKKVLANLQVYRARLGDPAALRLDADLTRTIGGRRAAAQSDPPEPAKP